MVRSNKVGTRFLDRGIASHNLTVDRSCYTAAAPWQQPHPEFLERLRGRLILAPLTKGGNLPFRRLCLDFGDDAGMPTMCAGRHPSDDTRLA